MTKNLLIVESPAKAKTIEKFLGKDFTVKSSYGHIRDLAKGDKGVNIEKKFEPTYTVSPEKKKVVKELKDLVKKVDEVWLATDEDREGEAISWHLCRVLDLDERKTKRIVFREITKPAIQQAIEAPRHVDVNLVNAQQARRILDRLVGFELSELLWRKVKNKLSAGRVQSVAVKLIVEREREINQFNSSAFFKVKAHFTVKNGQGKDVELVATYPDNFKAEQEARAFLEQLKASQFSIHSIEVKPAYRKPAPPFTTSTLQQEASRKLGFAVSRTMIAAQRLYEAGHITYMRTDSTTLSNLALSQIASLVENNYGKEYVKTRQFRSKQELAQEAHEAIRPTYVENENVTGDRDQVRLYDLIRKRAMASQMADARLEKTVVDIAISNLPGQFFEAEGEVLKFDGFLKVYLESKDDEEEDEHGSMLPPLKVGQVLSCNYVDATERYTKPPARYTEAGLVKKLEELGIGRPSTYAPTISKIMEEGRGYVVKDSRPGVERHYAVLTLANGTIKSEKKSEITGATKDRLYPTDMGMVVSDFLSEHFEKIMDYGFTADIEKEFDQIASGSREWRSMLEHFYDPFHELVEQTLENANRATGERILGTDPATGLTVSARVTRFGPVIQIGSREEVGEEGKPQFANLRTGMSIETVTLEEALDLFKLPKSLGNFRDQEVSVGVGRFGPYVKWGETFISLPRGTDPLKVDQEEAERIIIERINQDAPFGTYQGKPITKGKGRFGPFVKWEDLYVNVPRKYSLDTITEKEAIELIKAKVEKENNRYIQQWPEEKLSIENGRWGPFIRQGRAIIKIPKIDGEKVDADKAKTLTLEQVMNIVKEAKK
ncbi:MAG: type I DNA topoisomerase [Saprospiraceae bacterium]|nr:type I DNA topoisomerase [Saprospiraceae bacterium]HPG06250.1 type I DNA topoisomerase [Saprospiraceae bacterium]